MSRMLRLVFVAVLIMLGGVSSPLVAGKTPAKAQTTGDPDIPVDELFSVHRVRHACQ